jgi:hypothetical protein
MAGARATKMKTAVSRKLMREVIRAGMPTANRLIGEDGFEEGDSLSLLIQLNSSKKLIGLISAVWGRVSAV